MTDAFKNAVELAGGITAAAKALGVTGSAVSQCVSGKRPFPDAWALRLAAATDWQITPHELSPRFYPHPDDGLPPELRQGAKERAA